MIIAFQSRLKRPRSSLPECIPKTKTPQSCGRGSGGGGWSPDNTGDDSDNNIIVQEGGLVTGRAGTTINGNGRFEPFDVIHDINIKMKGGDDFIRVDAGPGTTVFRDVKIDTGMGDDIIEILGLRVRNETRIDTGDGDDLLFIDGVLTPFGFSRSDFTGKFTLDSGSGRDLFEFHNATFRDEVDVRLGFGIDGACGFEDSEFQRPHMVRFDGGPPSGGVSRDGGGYARVEFNTTAFGGLSPYRF